jgi:hypothetical protein
MSGAEGGPGKRAGENAGAAPRSDPYCASVLSQQGGEAGGSLIRVAPGRAGAALTKPGRVQHCQMGRARRAWRRGVREEPAFTFHNLAPGSNLADRGPDAARTCPS